jgi:hypothetical protein
MGVSNGVAEWLIELDNGKLSFIKTPPYANTYALHSHQNMIMEKRHICGATYIEELSFEAERGIGQDESAISLQRTLLYDMVLEWIDPKNRKLLEDENLREYSKEKARVAATYAYADDLATCSANPHKRNICSSSRQSNSPHVVHSLH